MAQDAPIELQNESVNEADIGALRWRAIEAANSLPDVSAVARRVMIQMICAMDAKTRECYPSELWLATMLGVHINSVKKAKVELRDKHYLVTWTNPDGPRHKSFYQFNWQKIIRLSDEAKARAKDAVEARRSKRKAGHSSPQTTYTSPGIGSPQTTIHDSHDAPMVVTTLLHGSQIAVQGSLQAAPKVAPRLPEQPFNNLIRTAQPYHASVAAAPDGRAAEPLAGERTEKPLPRVGKVAHEEGASSGVRTFAYPKLLDAFGDRPDVKDALFKLDSVHLFEASRRLSMKGKDAAAEYVTRAVA